MIAAHPIERQNPARQAGPGDALPAIHGRIGCSGCTPAEPYPPNRADRKTENLEVVRHNEVRVLNQKPQVGDFEISKRDLFRPGVVPFEPTGDTGGVLGHSQALIADGVDSLADIFGSIIVWRGLVVAETPPDEDHPYGHGKAEPLAAASAVKTPISQAARCTQRMSR